MAVISSVPPDLRPKPAAKPKQKFYTFAANVPVGPGQQLHFQTGRGYFVGPKVVVAPGRTAAAPAAPAHQDPYAALTAADVEKRAGEMAQHEIDPQTAEIRRQQAITDAQNAALVAARSGFGLAAADLLKGIDWHSGYDAASGDIGGLAKGFSGAAAQRLADVQGQNESFAESQGAGYKSTADPSQLGDTLYDLNGYIPGANLAEQGAHAQEFGNKQPGIELAQTKQDLDSLMAKARQDDDQYAQQLIQVAKTFPQLHDTALQQLQQYEIDKANFRLNRTNSAADNARQQRALIDNEKLAGIKQANTAAEFKYKWASLKLQTQKAQNAVQNASDRGRQIDAAGSKVRGFVVDKNGDFVLDETGARIPVKKSTASGGALTAYQKTQLTKEANATAIDLLGNPIPSGNRLAPGKFIAAPKAKGPDVYKGKFGQPRTTNNPKKAARDGTMTFAQAQSSLMSSYGITRARARAILVANGWKPDGKRS